jgi:hypothetical protein
MPVPRNIDGLLNSARVGINNALNSPKIQDYLAVYGYSSEKIQQGKALYEAALSAYQQQKIEFGKQIGATATLNLVWETASKSYIKFIKIARIAFKDDAGIATQLGLNGSRKNSLSGWLAQAQQFYGNLIDNTALITQLTEYGITLEKLQVGYAELQAVEVANLAQTREKGEAQNATQTRDMAIAALSKWFSDYVAIARIALEAESQLLESLGILERS